jgi:hypothetical protein
MNNKKQIARFNQKPKARWDWTKLLDALIALIISSICASFIILILGRDHCGFEDLPSLRRCYRWESHTWHYYLAIGLVTVFIKPVYVKIRDLPKKFREPPRFY